MRVSAGGGMRGRAARRWWRWCWRSRAARTRLVGGFVMTAHHLLVARRLVGLLDELLELLREAGVRRLRPRARLVVERLRRHRRQPVGERRLLLFDAIAHLPQVHRVGGRRGAPRRHARPRAGRAARDVRPRLEVGDVRRVARARALARRHARLRERRLRVRLLAVAVAAAHRRVELPRRLRRRPLVPVRPRRRLGGARRRRPRGGQMSG